jgi:hypothetical protein
VGPDSRDAPLGLVFSIPNDTSRGSSSKHGRLSEAMAPPSCVCLLYSRRQELIVQSHAVRDCAVNMHKIRMLRQYRQSAARGASLDSWIVRTADSQPSQWTGTIEFKSHSQPLDHAGLCLRVFGWSFRKPPEVHRFSAFPKQPPHF